MDHDQELRILEESLWRSSTRFDRDYMDKILSENFIEFGRSGKIYSRQEIINATPQEIEATLPLKDFKITKIDDDVRLITYISQVMNQQLDIGNRSSLWRRRPKGWELCFHQGTPAQWSQPKQLSP